MKKIFLLASFLVAVFHQKSYSQNFTDSNLPIVVFNTNNQIIDSAYAPAVVIWMGVIDNGNGNRNHLGDSYAYAGLIKIKTHGNSTLWYPKKSWNVTTVNSSYKNIDTTILGFPKEHDWIFKASYEDKSFLRDEVSFKIFNEMGHYASRIKYFELVVNGDYRGLYQLEEKIKRNKHRVDISKLKPTDLSGDSLTGGYMISIDRQKTGDHGWYSKYPSNQSGDSSNFYLYDYPKPDSMPQVQKDYIHNYFDKFEYIMQSSYWNNLDSGYSKYINLQSFIDKFIIEELSRNTDGYRLKDWFFKDRDSKGDGRLHATPIWDYAIGWGNCAFSGGNNPYWWQYQLGYYQNFIPFWWKKLLLDTNFQNELQCRYQFLRTNILDQNNLYANIDSFTNYLNEAQQRNFQRWQILGKDVYPNPQPPQPDYAGEISYLKWWISERLKWLDTYIPGVCQGLSVNENSSSNNLISIYPNPCTENFHLVYNIQTTGKAEAVIEVSNMLGERVFLKCGDKESGTYEENISASQLPAGVYTLKLRINNKSISHPIIKLQ